MLGVLGFESRKWKEVNKFQLLSSLDTEFVTQIALAEFHSLCLTEEGVVYAWGGNLHSVILFLNSETRSGQQRGDSYENHKLA